MSKPTPEPVDPSKLGELANKVIEEAKFPALASMDGDQPRLRPVSPVYREGFTIYVANLKMYHKTVEIAANPKVELLYVNGAHDQVRITGVAEVLRDRGTLEKIWNAYPLLRQFLGSIDNPALIVYKV